LNFEENTELGQFFGSNLSPQQILDSIRIYANETIQPHETLIIFDEIQECPHALNSLKYFNEQANDFHIVAAGSLLGIKLTHTQGFPVGKVNFLNLYPLSFFEFLDALGESTLRQQLEAQTQFSPIAEPIHNKLIGLLKKYMYVGGMPEVVAHFVKSNGLLTNIRAVQQEILRSYSLDFLNMLLPIRLLKSQRFGSRLLISLQKKIKNSIFR
jgi:predicted AAA+ superfamily ATPase